MTAVLLPNGKQQFFTTPGVPAVGYKLMTWAAGTSTPQTTWADALKIAANPNPIILDGRGEAVIFWDGAYKIQLQDATGAPVWSPVDNVSSLPTFSTSLIPTVDNSFTLGSPSFSWANLYLGAGDAAAYDPVTGNIGYYARTAAEITAGITPSNYVYSGDFMDPRRYGATGDGGTDDTAALNRWVAVVNASTNPVSHWPIGNTFFCTNLNAITAANFTWNCYSTLKAKPNLITAPLVTISGVNCKIRGLTINGNQAAFASTYGTGLLLTANNPTLEDVTITQTSAYGLILDSLSTTNTTISGGNLVNVTLTNCALTGYQFNNVAYLNVTNMVVNGCGWGFQQPFTQPGGSFGGSARFRSHHITFTSCQAMQNGRDGFNANQGAYALKYEDCLAWMNGDGGFTIAGDNTATGRLGEGEFCWDLEYINCEAYNNWAAGLSGETTVKNLTILGGRYYNNGRGCGLLGALLQSIPSGIFMNTTGSLGLVIKTKCYDDRQLCAVTASAAGVLMATNWGLGGGAVFVPTAANYPRVALYNAAMAFQGYGTITAESSGSVTIVTTAFSGVTIGSIAAGWFVSQRVQHNGCYIGAGSQGVVDIDGFGNLPSVGVDYGYKVFSYSPGNGQNIRNVNSELIASPELLANPSFDAGIGSGTTWTYTTPAGGSAAAYATPGVKLYSPAGLQLVGGSSIQSTALAALIASGGNYLVDCWFEVSCIVYAVNAGDAGIVATYTGGANATTLYHPGGGTRRLVIGGYLIGANTLSLTLFSSVGKTAWFDEASIKVKHEPVDSRDQFYPTRNLAV